MRRGSDGVGGVVRGGHRVVVVDHAMNAPEVLRVELASGGYVSLVVDIRWLEASYADLEFVRDLAARLRAYGSEPGSGVAPGEAVGGGWSEPPVPTDRLPSGDEPAFGGVLPLIGVDHVVAMVHGPSDPPAGFGWSQTLTPDGSPIGEPMLVPLSGFPVPRWSPLTPGVAILGDMVAAKLAEAGEAHGRDVWARTIGADLPEAPDRPPDFEAPGFRAWRLPESDGVRAEELAVAHCTCSGGPALNPSCVVHGEVADPATWAEQTRVVAEERERLERVADDLEASTRAAVAVADSGGSTEGPGTGAFVCEEPKCFRSFVTKQGLGMHRRRAHGAKWPSPAVRAPVPNLEEPDADGLVGCGVGDCKARRSPDKIATHRLSLHGV